MTDDPAFERDRAFSIDEIQAEDDLATLCDWFTTSDRREIHIKTFIDAWRHAGIEDEAWSRRTAGALAYCVIGKRWIERKILTLGGTPPYAPTDPRARQLRILNDKVTELQKRIDELEREKSTTVSASADG